MTERPLAALLVEAESIAVPEAASVPLPGAATMGLGLLNDGHEVPPPHLPIHDREIRTNEPRYMLDEGGTLDKSPTTATGTKD